MVMRLPPDIEPLENEAEHPVEIFAAPAAIVTVAILSALFGGVVALAILTAVDRHSAVSAVGYPAVAIICIAAGLVAGLRFAIGRA